MIQVDVFWSFAMGACLATLAGDRLIGAPSLFVNRFFVYTVCYLSVIFSPSGVYLLWQHTGWETMFYYGIHELHGLAPCLFASTNVLLGIIGFAVCGNLVRSGKHETAHTVWITSYQCMFAILSFGYDRFLYPGTLAEFRKGVKYPLMDFFSSEIFYTLLLMGVFVIPLLYLPMMSWPSGARTKGYHKRDVLRHSVTAYYRVAGMIISSYILAFCLNWLPSTWHVDRLLAFVLGECVFGLFVFAPIMMIPKYRGAQKKVE